MFKPPRGSRGKKKTVKSPPNDETQEEGIILTNFQPLADTDEEINIVEEDTEKTQPEKEVKILAITLSTEDMNYEVLRNILYKTTQYYKTQFLGRNLKTYIGSLEGF